MILVGQYDSPYVRRVAVSLRVLGHDYRHDKRSVFGDFASMLTTNPLGRIPSLILDDGTVLVDSNAILDWLDETAGPARALVPGRGLERRRALQRIALATGIIDKAGAVAYERIIRPAAYRWPDWIARLETQAGGAIAALAAMEWPAAAPLDQARITTACVWRYLRMSVPNLVPAGRYPALEALSERCEALPEFKATYPTEYAVPRAG
jgi:glutathione S-transferase